MKHGPVSAALMLFSVLSVFSVQADELSSATEHLVRQIREAERQLRQFPAYEEDAPGAYAHLMRMLRRSLEEQFLQDPDYPFFRVLDDWVREGGDNPDQRYLFARLKGGERYRVWGNVGSAHAVELQLYEGQPWAGKGQAGDYLPSRELVTDAEGNFEVVLSAERTGKNWLAMNSATDTVVVRQIYREWTDAAPGRIHIDRLENTSQPKPVANSEDVARRIRNTGDAVRLSTLVWPGFVQQRYVDEQLLNRVSSLIDTETVGGAEGRWMAHGVHNLQEDEVLLLKMPPTSARYQAIQLADMWFASLEYADCITSLNDAQSIVAADGNTYYVISATDPGYPNWLDAEGGKRGVFLLRYDGVNGVIDKSLWPEARLLKREALRTAIPGYREASAQERQSTLRERRRHVQVRYGK